MATQVPEELETFLAKYPQMIPIVQALSSYHAGLPVEVRCTTCGGQLVVQDFPELGSLWVSCNKGCTSYHEQYRPQERASEQK